MKIRKAKFLFYLSLSKKTYKDNDFISLHVKEMISTLNAFGYSDPDLIICAWLFYINLDKSFIEDSFGLKIANIIENSNKSYDVIQSNRFSSILTIVARIAHINYFIENGKSDLYDSFQKTHWDLFYGKLYTFNKCDKLWVYLNDTMQKDWKKLMCI